MGLLHSVKQWWKGSRFSLGYHSNSQTPSFEQLESRVLLDGTGLTAPDLSPSIDPSPLPGMEVDLNLHNAPPAESSEVSGIISADTTWTVSEGPYIVTGNLLVAEGVTLTIEAGVEVRFDPGTYMKVEGFLVAVGTESDPITFTSNSASPFAGDWLGIRIRPTAGTTYGTDWAYESGSVMDYVTISYAYTGLYVFNTGLLVEHSQFTHNQNAIEIRSTEGFVLRASSLSGNHKGIYSVYSDSNGDTVSDIVSTQIYNNTFASNGYGMDLFLDLGIFEGLAIVDNTFQGHHYSSIAVGSFSCHVHSILIEGNWIHSNSSSSRGLWFREFKHTASGANPDYQVIVRDNLIENNAGASIWKQHSNNVGFLIEHNIFSKNDEGVIWSGRGSVNSVFSRNTVVGNGFGVWIEETNFSYPDNLEMSENTFLDNGNEPLVAINGGSGHNFTNNTIYHTGPLVLANNTAHDVAAQGNYWGTMDVSLIAGMIHDYYDDFELGEVLADPVLGSPNTTAPVSVPVGLEALATGAGVELSWAANEETDVVGYRVHYATESGRPYDGTGANEGPSGIDVGDVTSFTLTGLAAGEDYYITVTAYDGEADGDNDQFEGHESWFTEEVIPSLTDQTAPANVSALLAVPGNSEIHLSWINPRNPDVAGVRIVRSTNDYPQEISDGEVVYDGPDSSYLDTGLITGTTYYYTLFCYDEAMNYSSGTNAEAVPDKVSGIISADTTWTLSGGPYIVTGNLLVVEGVTLTIEAGVEVRFEPDTYLRVEGSLVAIGTSETPITFTSNSETPSKGDWAGLKIRPSAGTNYGPDWQYDSGSILDYVTLSYADTGLYVFGTGLLIERSEFRHNNKAIEIRSTNGFVLRGSSLSDNDRGIYSIYSDSNGDTVSDIVSTQIYDNTFTSNGHGMDLFLDGGVFEGLAIVDNTFQGHHYSSIAVGSHACYVHSILIEGNWIHSNSNGGLWFRSFNRVASGADPDYQVIVRDNLIENNADASIWKQHSNNVGFLIEHNIFSENDEGVIWSGRGSANSVFSQNTVVGNGFGVWIEKTDDSLEMSENTFLDNGDELLVAINGGSGHNFTNNTIYHTGPLVLANNSVHDVQAQGNYWGTTDVSLIAGMIHDYYDDFELGEVLADPFLSGPNTAAPISVPAGLDALATGAGVVLSWAENEETDVAGYRVYYTMESGRPYDGTSANEGASGIDVGDVTSFTLTGLAAGEDYYITVTAYDSEADGDNDQFEGHESWFAEAANVFVENTAPVITSFVSNATMAEPGREEIEVLFTAAFVDNFQDTHTATLLWGDGNSSTVVVDEGAITAKHVYPFGGLYDISLVLEDQDGATGEATTQAVVEGVGLHDGQLQVIGSTGHDYVQLSMLPGNAFRPTEITVFADFLAAGGQYRSYLKKDVDHMLILLNDGNDNVVTVGRVTRDMIIDGGAGSDNIMSGYGNDILLGSDGNDILQGSRGRDILIGGLGGDTLLGGYGQDILIGGYTSFSSEVSLNRLPDITALSAIQAEWASSRGSLKRLGNISGTDPRSDRFNGKYFLILGETVFDDGEFDTLLGGRGNNWLWE